MASRGNNQQGVQLYQMGNYAGAAQYFQMAVQANPRDADAYYNLASSYHQLAKSTRDQATFDQAERLYGQCLAFSPQHADCHRGLAVLLVEQGRSQEAVARLQDWAYRAPASSVPRVELARLREETGDPLGARQALVEALTLNPYDSRALAALGRLYEQSGDTAQALANYQRSLQYNRSQPELTARVAALQSGYFQSPNGTPAGGTRTVQGSGTQWR